MPLRFYPGSRTAFHTISYSIVFLGLSLIASPATNAQWSVTPSIAAGLEYDDNPSLNSGLTSITDVFGYALEADASFSYSSPLTDFSFTPRYLGTKYDEFSELDSNDWLLNLDYLYTGERSTFSFRGSYADEAIRRAERSDVDFDVDDPTDIPDDQSGRVLGSENRQRLQFVPDWYYQIGQRSLIRLGANYLDVSYDRSSNTLLADYTDARGLFTFEHDWTQRNTIAVDAYYRENDFARISGKLTGQGITLGIVRNLSENSRFVIKAGIDSTEDEFGSDQTNPIGEISFSHRLRVSRVLAAYRRTISGSGSSELSVRDTISLLLSRGLSDKFTISGGVQAYQTSALDDNAVNNDEQKYLQLRLLFVYNISPTFSIDLDYRYTDLDRELTVTNAESNLVNLWFRYRALQ